MDAIGVIEILRKVFTFGDATNTHLDIVRYLDCCRIKEATYSKWGRNAYQQGTQADPKKHEGER